MQSHRIVEPASAADGNSARSVHSQPASAMRLLLGTVWLSAALLTLGGLVVYFPVRWEHLVNEARHFSAELGATPNAYAFVSIGIETILVLSFIATAALLLWKKPEQRMALYVSFVLVGLSIGVISSAVASEESATLWRWWVSFTGSAGWTGLFILLYLFPDGRFVPRWTILAAGAWIALSASFLLFPGTPLDADTWHPVLMIGAFLSLWGTGLYSQFYRYRHVSSPVQRQQTKWVLTGFTTAMAVAVTFNEVMPAITDLSPAALAGFNWLVTVSLLLIPVSLGIAILQHRLWDVDLLINRALVYSLLTASIIAIYIIVVGYVGSLFRAENHLVISLIATGVVAVLFHSFRDQLQLLVNRLMYGERDEPYKVISRLGQRLEDTFEPHAVLPTIVETVKDALRLPYVAIALKRDGGFYVAATAGEPRSSPDSLPLTHHGELVGQLLIESRSPGEQFSSIDWGLLENLARHAGVAAHSVRLTADLQRARERLVTTREEERRRLRRELHDSVGPRLASQPLALDAACRLLAEDPKAAVELLQGLKAHSQEAIGEIRRIAYDLRPPALDDLGLLVALQEQIDTHRHLGLHIKLTTPSDLPDLPAAVEVAVYRIVLEALTNVVRHASARHCEVTLNIVEGSMVIRVLDDGCGLPVGYKLGVGLQSIRERTEELGGKLTITSSDEIGTEIVVRIPLPEEQ